MNKIESVLFRLIISLITLSALESCSIFGIEKIIIRRSDFTQTDNDILFKGKLYSIHLKNDESIIFPAHYSDPAIVAYNKSNAKKNSTDITIEYQPTIMFLTKERFVVDMGCTIYGQLSKNKENSFDIIYLENSNDCNSLKFNTIKTLVINSLKASTKCIIENDEISFKKDGKVLMVYKVI